MADQPDNRGPKNSKSHKWIRIVVSYGIAAACLFWVFHDINPHQLLKSLTGMNGWWVALAALLQLSSYCCVALEWKLLLRPLGRVPLIKVTQAVFAGRFANDVLPVQLGYVIRAFLVSRWMKTEIAPVLSSLILERLFDGFWLAAGIGLTAAFVPLPPAVVHARNILAIVIAAGVTLTLFVVLKHRDYSTSRNASGGTGSKWIASTIEFVHKIIEGIRRLAQSHQLPAVIALAVLKLAIQAASYVAMLWAFGFEMSVWMGAAAFLVAYLGICVPSTPASAGVFQLFSVAGLTWLGISKTEATGFSLAAFVVFTVPLALAGFFALAQSGMSLREIRKEIRGRTGHKD